VAFGSGSGSHRFGSRTYHMKYLLENYLEVMAGVLLEEILHPLVIDFQVGNLPTRKVLFTTKKRIKQDKVIENSKSAKLQKQKVQFLLFNS
jgi:hypothetical protein